MYQLPHNKTYALLDFIKIPFLICPLYTSVKIANQILNAFIPSIQLLITANFIDTALDIFNDKLHRSAIYTPLILLMLIVAYTYLNWQLMSFINLKTEIRMTKIYRSEVADKRAKLEYKHIESNETWDLISRTCANPVGRIQGGFDNIMSATNIVIRVLSLLLILITQVWWAGIAIVLIAIPLFALAIKGGKETYKANKEAKNILGVQITFKVCSKEEIM